MGKIVCTNGSFYHLVLKMVLQNFKGSWIKFCGLSFAKCYINDIIAFSLIPSDRMHHL